VKFLRKETRNKASAKGAGGIFAKNIGKNKKLERKAQEATARAER